MILLPAGRLIDKKDGIKQSIEQARGHKKMAQDKRVTPRLSIQDRVTLAVCGESGTTPCILDNVSQGGARFFTSRELAVGSRVELRIASPDDGMEISLLAQIIRVLPGRESGQFDYACRLESVENA